MHRRGGIMIDTLSVSEGPVAPSVLAAEPRRGLLARYSYRDGDHELTLTSPVVRGAQVKAVERGDAEFALVVEDPVVLLCAKFGEAIPWSTATVSWAGEARRLFPM